MLIFKLEKKTPLWRLSKSGNQVDTNNKFFILLLLYYILKIIIIIIIIIWKLLLIFPRFWSSFFLCWILATLGNMDQFSHFHCFNFRPFKNLLIHRLQIWILHGCALPLTINFYLFLLCFHMVFHHSLLLISMSNII